MNSICILLTDDESINEKLILKSIVKLKKSKLKAIYFIGDRDLFKKIYLASQNNQKFFFLNISLIKKNYFNYLKKITTAGIKLGNKKKIQILINMPLDKKKFLKKKFPGFTEFFSYYYDRRKNENMLLFGKKFSVCPLTTHLELKDVYKKISKHKLINTVKNIMNFNKKINAKNREIIVLGLNPHASKDIMGPSIDKDCIKSVVDIFLKKKIKIKGPVSADTAFNNFKDKVFIGMYHDQVLIPFKMINKFKGINITIGKKILRISPDHGTAKELKINTNKINNQSFNECIKFCENINA